MHSTAAAVVLVVMAAGASSAGPSADPEASWSAAARAGNQFTTWSPRAEAEVSLRRGWIALSAVAAYARDHDDYFHFEAISAGPRLQLWEDDEAALGIGYRFVGDHVWRSDTGASGWRTGHAVDLVGLVNLPGTIGHFQPQLAVVVSFEDYARLPVPGPACKDQCTVFEIRRFVGVFVGFRR